MLNEDVLRTVKLLAVKGNPYPVFKKVLTEVRGYET